MPQPRLSSADVEILRGQFPALARRVNRSPLVYLDSASTTQTPTAVLAAIARPPNVDATEACEAVRATAAALLGASDPREIVLVRGTTEAVELVAQSYGRANVHAGDEIVVSELEHRSNLVPWQMLCREVGARLRVLPIDDRGEIVLAHLDELLGSRTRIVAVAHVSNSLGTVLPIIEIVRRARAAGAVTVIDGAQAVAHRPVDVGAIGCDFYAFSGHKLYGPAGCGVLWGRRALLETMPPWRGGGGDVSPPLDARTPDVGAIVGLGAAIDWIRAIGLDCVAAREAELLAYATRVVGDVLDVRVIGTARDKSAIVSLTVGDIQPRDIGAALERDGVAVHAGHHCAQPVMDHFGVDATVRASLGIYTTAADLDRLGASLDKARTLLKRR